VQSIVGNEILKTSFKWRSAIAFIAVAVIVPLVMIGVKLQGDAVVKGATRALGQDFLLLGNILNGYFVTALIMNSLWVHIPFLITLGAGDQLAGDEFNAAKWADQQLFHGPAFPFAGHGERRELRRDNHHDDGDQALKKYHLTARQAGTIARQAWVKRMIPFHFSPKYTGFENILRTEAERAFKGL